MKYADLKIGTVIPAHPLALDVNRKLDERRQVALTRYYCDAGAGGLAVGVHTTQFAIRDPRISLFEPVLRLVMDAICEWEQKNQRSILKVAGAIGPTDQAVREASFAKRCGYDFGLLSLAALGKAGDDELIAHCRAVAEIIPLFGFYLQPAVGGRVLGYAFWRRFFEIENVAAVKIAPFNRYQTLEVVRALAESGRHQEIALYTGNDDNIVVDLLTEHRFGDRRLRIVGGLLGHWAVWTRRAVALLKEIKSESKDLPALLTRAIEVTDTNAAFFDAGNGYAGCIAGLHEVLRRQGVLEGRWCLDPHEDLSPGQVEEIDRVYAAYPHLNDDAFVSDRLDSWMR